MVHLSSDTKEVIVQKVLLRDNNSTVKEIAVNHNIGYSTLQRWVKNYKDNTVRHHNQSNIYMNKLSTEDRFNHLIAVSSLNDTQISAYCRQHGIFKFQLNNWKESFMSTSQNHKNRENMSELKLLRAENKKLKQELNRKESALAEAAALLVLQKKTALIWGAKEED